MPADWTGANLTFQFSSDGSGYNDMYDENGDEVTLPEIPAGGGYVLNREFLSSLAFIKIRSGTAEHPVVQKADREFALAVESEAARLARRG